MRVLLIEDDPDIQKMVELSLTLVGKHEVVGIASSGAEGLRLAGQLQPDLILLDVMMPEMDGYETCRRLKASTETAEIPVIFLSAKAQAAEQAKGKALGAIGYLVKPFDPMALPAAVEALVRGQQ